ncbi:MAG: hypothetical protein JW808_06805 [Victivallales bacterium]|nr:hypothetical protein [Victivallales bacterium]
MKSALKTIYTLLVFGFSVVAVAQKSAEDIGAKIKASGIRVPVYQEGRDIPLLVLTSEEARPIGVRFEMRGVRLVWLGDSVQDIRGTVKTPVAVFDQSTSTVAGGERITYESAEIDVEGIGFDIDIAEKVLHVRSHVVVTIKGDLSSAKQAREARGKAGKGGALTLKPPAVKDPSVEEPDGLGEFLQELRKSNPETKDNDE